MALFASHIITPDSALGGKVIEKSLRFNGQNETTAPQLRRTGTTTSSSFSIAMWAKLSRVSDQYKMFFSIGQENDANAAWVSVLDGQNMGFQGGNGTYTTITRVFRDPTSWFHFLISVNSNNFTVYIDGTSVQTGTIRSLDTSTNGIRIGANYGNYYPWNGYLADVYLIDGQAKAPTDFGYTESQTGIWRPKKYTGTFGTGGAHLEFKDSSSVAALGKDTSGNGNDFTPTTDGFNVTAGVTNDSFEDTPTNNFPTMNPLNRGVDNPTCTDGNLYFGGSTDHVNVATLEIPSSGKWYWEYTKTANTNLMSGIIGDPEKILNGTSTYLGGQANGYSVYAANGQTYAAGSNATYMATPSTSTTIMIAFDADNRRLYFGADGNWGDGSGNTNQTFANAAIAHTVTAGITYYPAGSFNGGSAFANFGQRAFSYTPPTGYRALNSRNRATPVAAGVANPHKFFDTITYTGDGATVRPMTGLAFKPDMVWIKGRDYDYTNHGLCDSVKFDTTYPTNRTMLYPNLANAETLGGNYFAHFTSTGEQPFFEGGFILNNNTSGNNNGNTFVAWAWKAGGNTTSSLPFMIDDVGYATAAAAGLDGGTKNPTGASVSTKAGFSIVTYVASNGTNDTIYHGLNQAPEVLIAKDRDNSRDWGFYYSVNGTNTNWQKLNDTATEFSNDSGETLGGVSGSYMYLHEDYFQPAHSSFANGGDDGADKMVAYMWHSVPGFSKIGVYHGNGSSNGQFVNCGFRPAWVLIKRTSGSGQAWLLMDNKRSPSNPVTKTSSPQSNRAEDLDTGGIPTDFLSTGFKCRGTGGDFNSSSYKYFFMAFAEQPNSTPFGIDANSL